MAAELALTAAELRRLMREAKRKKWEDMLAFQIKAAGLPEPEREYRFHKERRWRFDFTWLDMMLAVEVEGGTWSRGRHTRGSGFAGDCEKHNAAILAGFRLLRFTGDMVRDGSALSIIEMALGG